MFTLSGALAGEGSVPVRPLSPSGDWTGEESLPAGLHRLPEGRGRCRPIYPARRPLRHPFRLPAETDDGAMLSHAFKHRYRKVQRYCTCFVSAVILCVIAFYAWRLKKGV